MEHHAEVLRGGVWRARCQLARCGGVGAGSCGFGAGRGRHPSGVGAVRDAPSTADFAVSHSVAVLRPAHHAAHVRGDLRLPALHLPMPRRRPRAEAPRWCSSRCSTCCSRCRSWAISPSPSSSSSPVSRGDTGGGAGGDLRHLHQPGLEHGLQLLPVAAHAARRPRRGARAVPPLAWQRFWRLEVPFAMPGLVWNTMMSMSGGWFFVVASEAITVGDHCHAARRRLLCRAAPSSKRNLGAVGWAIVAMTLVILLYDQLLFRPMVAWADKFRFEQTAVAGRRQELGSSTSSPRAGIMRAWLAPLGGWLDRAARARLALPVHCRRLRRGSRTSRGGCRMVRSGHCRRRRGLWLACWCVREHRLRLSDVEIASRPALLTLFRVLVLIVLAS